MQTKLHINLTQGIIDVEGDVDFVKAVYKDFKDHIAAQSPVASSPPENSAALSAGAGGETPPKRKRRMTSRTATETKTLSISADSPTRDKNLDTPKIQPFYDQYAPGSAPEKILIFLKFLIDKLGIAKPNTDQVYTCFLDVREKPPQAFAQAFRDTSSKKGFIDFKSSEDITITTKGNNHFEFDLKRKNVE
ncbi:hypothetical protein JM93_00891 [Roseibium hamelinense]|uniref:Uncharacterized protein n=1 Tax=Roseibium hamelinense TaxID=150831 RepID=A0A562TI72_9HYPH|nr:hypothetical protein [Roseibium hamelinense]MTI42591.1 hypothetical protein [Roseibium hamelinense]TWI93335.1 hypothetical protein JM93_00891 [Roseibium hamelinense]